MPLFTRQEMSLTESSTEPFIFISLRSGQQLKQEEAIILDMGQYMFCPKGSTVPMILQPNDLHQQESSVPLSPITGDRAADVSLSPSRRTAVLHMYQVLAPSLAARGRLFGSRLALKEEWVSIDPPYFSSVGECRWAEYERALMCKQPLVQFSPEPSSPLSLPS